MPVAKTKEQGQSAVVVAMADAERALQRQRRRRKDPPPHVLRGEGNDVGPGKWTPNHLGLPSEDPCPVVPLGYENNTKFFLDSDGTFRELSAKDLSHAGIQDLFASAPHYPQWAWPRYGRKPATEPGEPEKPPPIKSFEDDAVRSALLLACSRKGPFSATDKLRGRGAWALKGGAMIYHAGEEVWTFENGKPRAKDTGLHGDHLYPRLPGLPAPWTEDITADNNPAGALLETLRMWNWERPDVDPVLMLGWIGVAYLGGVLDWRSAVLLLGDKGTGKSSLQEGLRELFGEALFHSSDTSAAGIYQNMRNDTRPVALDELEPGANPGKVDAVVRLMRDASSGAIGRRGGSDGVASEFQMRSAFLFSAINNPLTLAQDLSRVAVLRLKPLTKTQTTAPTIDDGDGGLVGRKLLAILMREWPKFEDVRAQYMGALAGGGHDARGQKTYGTLLAAADVMLGPELAEQCNVHMACTDQVAWWSEHLSADALPEIEDAKPNWRACLDHLLTVQIDAWRGGKRASIGEALDGIERTANDQKTDTYSRADAKRDLGSAGIGLDDALDLINRTIVALRSELQGVPIAELKLRAQEILGLKENDGLVLAIPNRHPNLKKLFTGTEWANESWKDALRQCPYSGIIISDRRVNRVQIAGVQTRCTLVVLDRYREAPER